MNRLALVCLLGCAYPRSSVPEIGKPKGTVALSVPDSPVPLPAPFTCGILARAEGCDPLWGCVHIREEIGSCYATTSAVLTLHRDEPRLDPEDLPLDGGLVISSFEVQMSGREICGTHPLEAVKCAIDRANGCGGEILATCRFWKDGHDEAEVPRIERSTLRVNES